MYRADDVATASSPSFDDDYERVSCAGEDGDSVLRCPVTFDADVDPTFDAAQAVDEDVERRLHDENTLLSEKRVAGQDKGERILERGGGGDFLRLRWTKVPPVREIEISRE